MKCKNCGDPVDPRRVQLGYDYCLKDECQQRCLSPVQLASIGVNKAADYYTTANELLPPPLARSDQPVSEPEEPVEPERVAAPRPPRPARPKVKSTLDKLRDQEAALDAALEARYQRFRRGEITAKQLDRQRDDLIRRFNEVVMAENIRYRGMLRKRPVLTR